MARLCGVTEGRISQLKSDGKLTDMSDEGAQNFLRERAEREAFQKRVHERYEQRHAEQVTELRACVRELELVNRNLTLLLVAQGVSVLSQAATSHEPAAAPRPRRSG